MSYKKILADIKKGNFAPIYFLYGEEEFYKHEISDALDQHVLTEEQKAFNKMVVSARESGVSGILDHARRFPVMAERQFVVCRDMENIKDLEPFLPYFENPANTTVLLLISSKTKIDKRLKVYKTLGKTGLVFEAKRPYENKMPGLIQDYTELKGRKISPPAARLIAEYLGMDLKKTANELDKLCISLEEGKTISVDEIEKSIGISREFNVYELQRALAQGKGGKALFITEQMGGNMKTNSLPMVTASFYSYFSKVYRVKFMGRVEAREMASRLGVNPFFVAEYRQAARTFPVDVLEQVFHLLLTYDLKAKGIDSVHTEGRDLFRELVSRIVSLLPVSTAKV